MNYKKLYNELVGSRKASTTPSDYYETHHIVPRCMGGTDDDSNLVKLTAREHFIAHTLLCKIYPNSHKLHCAMVLMCASKTGKRNTNRLYEYHRKLFAKSNSAYWKEHWKHHEHPKGFLGNKHTKETRKKMSYAIKNSKHAKEKSRRVYKYDMDGNFICAYDCLSDAAKSVGAKSPSNIKYTADGKFQYAHGFRWSYHKNAVFGDIKPKRYKGNRGKMWITNGVDSKTIDKTAEIPDGWWHGRTL